MQQIDVMMAINSMSAITQAIHYGQPCEWRVAGGWVGSEHGSALRRCELGRRRQAGCCAPHHHQRPAL